MALKRIHILISGRVQGVFFRAFVKENAEELNINGWVKNTSDSQVEIIAEGDEKNINKFVELCKKGPAAAEVDDIDVKEGKPGKDFSGFEIAY